MVSCRIFQNFIEIKLKNDVNLLNYDIDNKDNILILKFWYCSISTFSSLLFFHIFQLQLELKY